ncbi:MAG: GAF domain-containing protein [Chloroflexi bacterium]|nr:GAF domain-containing protein [Chloroflexota bacterium]
MWIYDLETLCFLDVNEAAIEHYGYSRVEFLKMKISDIRPQEDVERVKKHVQAKRPRLQHSGEWRHCKKDGSIIHVEITSHKLIYEGHKAALVSAKDITANKLAQKSLAESEERYRNLVENSLAGIYQTTVQGKIIYANDVLAQWMGFKSAKEMLLLGSAQELYKHPGDRKKIIAALKRDGVITNFETQFVARSGEVKWVWISASLKDNVISGIVHNITESKRLEDAARALEASYHSLFNSVAEAIYIQDRKGRFLDVNDGAVKMYGYPREFLIGKTPALISAPGRNDLKKVQRAIQLAFEGQPQEFEFWGLRSNGEVFPKNVRLYNGTYLGQDVVIALAQDITERKLAEQALRMAEAKYRSLVEHVSVIVYMDAVDHLSSNIYMSPQVEKILGYSADECVADGQFWLSIIHPDDRSNWLAENDRTNQTGDPFQLEYRVMARDGRIVWVRDESVLMRDDSGRPLFWQGVMIDITDRKQAEESLTASEAELRALFASIPDVVLVLDKEGRYLKIAPTNPDLLHQPAEIMLGKRMHEVFSRQKADELTGHIREALDKKQTVRFEYALLLGGQITWFAGTTSPLTEDSVVWVGRDITARKLAEDALLASQDLLKDAQRIAHIGSWDLDLKTDVLTWSDEVYRIFEIDPQQFEVSYAGLLNAIHPDDRAMADQAYADSVKNKTPYSITHRLLFPDERIKYVHERCETIYNAIGEPVRSIGTVQDITERKLAEDALQQRINELSMIYAASQRLQQILTPETLAEELIHLLEKILKYEYGAILLIDKPSGRLIPFAVSDQGRGIEFAETDKKFIASHDFRVGHGITGWVAEHGQSVCLGDIQNDSRYYGLRTDVNSELCVPLRVGDQIVGVVNIESARLNAFTESDQRLLETIAAQIAIAIQNARLFEAEHLRRQEAETLRNAANTLTSSLDLEDVLNGLLDGLSLVVPFNSAAVFLKENGNYRAIAARGFDSPEQVKGQTLPGTNELAYIVEETCRPLILPDAKTDDRFEGWGPADKIRGWMGVPLVVRDQAIGFLTIDSHHPDAFTDADSEMALAFANHAAAAIQNARLYQDALRRMSELQALHESGLALGKSLDPREISEKVVSVLSHGLNWHHAAVRVRRGNSDEVELLAFSQTNREGLIEKIDTGRLMAGKTITNVSDGMAGWVIKHGRMINNGSLQDDPRYYETFPGMQSGLYVPIWAGGQTLGCISVESEQPNAFNEADERLLTTLASQAASALENARLFAAEQSRRRDAEILQQAASALSSSLDPQLVVDKLLDGLSQVISFDSSTVFIEEKGMLRAISGRGLIYPEKVIGRLFPGNGELAKQIWETRRPVIVPDAKGDARFGKWGTDQPIRGWMGVPLIARGNVIGYLTLDSLSPNAYGDADAEMARAFGSHAAAAIENARLYQDAVRSTERRQVLHAASQEIARISQDLQQVYASIHRAATQLMPTEAFVISLLDEERSEVEGVYLFDRNGRSPAVRIPLGQGLSSRVIASGESILINDDLENNVAGVHFGSQDAVRSILAVPLRVGGKVIGAISAQTYQPGIYDDEDRLLLELLAVQAAIAIQNARLYQDALYAAERRSVLHLAGQEIVRLGQDSEQLYKAIYQAALRLMPTDMFTIALVNDAENQIDGVYAIDRGVRGPFVSFPFNMGIAGWVIGMNKTLLLKDYDDPSVTIERVQFSDNQPTRSVLAVPLRSGEKVIGSMSVQNYEVNRYTAEDSILLEMLAAQAAVALENVRLFEQVRRRIKELESLNRASQALTGSLDLEPLLENILSSAKDAIAGAEKGTILLWDKDGDYLRVHTQIGYTDARILELPFRSEKGYSGRAFREKRPILIENALTDYELPFDESIEEVYAVQSGIVAPLIVKDAAIGVIALDNATKKGAFTKEDLNLLMLFASSAASVIENARLLAETRRRAGEFEALYQTAADVASQTDLKVLLDTIIKRAQTLSGSSGSGLYLFDPERGDLELAAINDPDIRAGTRLVLGEGVSGRIAQTKQPLIVNDYQTWENSSSHYKGLPITSVLGIPMLYSGELIGVLNVHNRADINQTESAHTFGEQDINLLSLLANAAAGAVYSARLLDQTRRRLDELGALAQVSSALRAVATRSEMVPVVLDQLMEIIHADGAALITSILGRDELLIEAARGTNAAYAGMWIPPGESLSRVVIETGKAYISPDVRTDARLFRPGVTDAVRAMAIVPLKYLDDTIGALSLVREEKDGRMPPPFSEADVRLLNAIADMAANALQRSSLHEETVRYAGQLVIINDLGHSLSETLDLAHIYEKLSRATLDLLPDSAAVFVSLFDSRERSVETVYGVQAGAVVNPADLPSVLFDESGYGNQSQVILSGKPLIVPDLSVSLEEKKDILIKSVNEERITQSALYVPMKAEGQVIGVLHAQSYDKNRYKVTDAKMLELVANTAGAAVQNARLFMQIKRRVDQLSALHAVDTTISSTTDLRVSLQAVLGNVARHLKVDAADVLLLNSSTLVLQYAAGLGFFTAEIAHTNLPLGKGLAGISALERRVVRIPSLAEAGVGFIRDNLISSEKFVAYLAVPLIAKGEVKGVLEIFQRSSLEQDDDWMSFLEMLAGQAALAIDNALLFEGLEKVNIELTMAYDATIQGWSQALELRDQETQGHSMRVLGLTLRLAGALGISDKEIQDMRRGVLLHDIGKMGIPDSILHKPGKLTDEEWEIMRKHPKYAYDMLSPIVYLRNSLDIPYCHHEKWDGTGYPRGLSGETIPRAARIFAVVDVYDALTSDRPYRQAWSKEKTLDYIREQSGTHFDPRIVDIFLKFIEE